MKLNFKTLFKIGSAIFLLYLCIYHWPSIFGFIKTAIGAASPLILGFVLAFVLNILMSFYERHYFTKSQKPMVQKSRRPVCLTLALLTLIAIITLIIALVLPQLISCIKLIISELPTAINNLLTALGESEFLSGEVVSSLLSIDWQSKIGGIANTVFSGLGSVVDIVVAALSSVFSGVVTVFIGIIFACYLLIQKETLYLQCRVLLKHYFKPVVTNKVKYVTEVANNCFRRYIIGQCTEAVILGVLCTIGMLVLRLPYATMIGAFIAFTALIPIAGAYIGAAVGAFMIVMVSPIKALIFIIFIIVLQQFEGNIIYPRVVGSSLGLPSIWVLAAITVGGGVLGIGGMLLGVPLAATIYHIIKDNLNKNNEVDSFEKNPSKDNPKKE